ncbi:MAG: putative PEP-binding protein [Candidatus Dojkabacteria bacterium]|nr:putative PEP-binding protein [Candidatus Dojkabacteria bacterium]
MTKNNIDYTHFGSVFSRDTLTGKVEPRANLLSFNDDKVYSFNSIPTELKNIIVGLLKEEEYKEKSLIEFLILINFKNLEYKIIIKKKAKLSTKEFGNTYFEYLDSKLITETDLLNLTTLDIYKDFFVKKISNAKELKKITTADEISTGAVSGILSTSKENTLSLLKQKQDAIWFLKEVSAEDLKVFGKVKGLLLNSAGITSHAAVVAKGLGVPTLTNVDFESIKKYEGETITIDTSLSTIYLGKAKLTSAIDKKFISRFIDISVKNKTIKVLSNSDTSDQIKTALQYRAEGIGLLRTEHMFTGDNANLIRELIFSEETSKELKERIISSQSKDFYSIFKLLEGKDVVVRFLDAPLHEFIPKGESEVKLLSKKLGISVNSLKSKIEFMHEQNPMLGFRGIRMLLKRPEIIEIQTKAINKAISKLQKNKIKTPKIVIEAPLISDTAELRLFKVEVNKYIELDKFRFGAMVETPRAAILSE